MLPIAPSYCCTITLLTPRAYSRLSSHLLSLPFSSLLLFLSLFILALYPPSLPRAYLDARLKIDPVTAIGDILKSRAAEWGRASERASEWPRNERRISPSVNERMSAQSRLVAPPRNGVSSAWFFRCRSTCSTSSHPPSRLGRYVPEVFFQIEPGLNKEEGRSRIRNFRTSKNYGSLF